MAGVEVLVVVEGQAENESVCRGYRLDAGPIGGDPVDLPRLSPHQMSPSASIAIPSGWQSRGSLNMPSKKTSALSRGSMGSKVLSHLCPVGICGVMGLFGSAKRCLGTRG